LLFRDGKKVRAHRWLMEQKIGRKLLPDEQIHHRDGNPLNNSLENLEVIDHLTHMRLHKQIYPDEKQCVVCGSAFIVNPRKRRRNKTCSQKCAQSMRIAWRNKSP
jgi:predicted nucleic acid-binding Zn ribbon protein